MAIFKLPHGLDLLHFQDHHSVEANIWSYLLLDWRELVVTRILRELKGSCCMVLRNTGHWLFSVLLCPSGFCSTVYPSSWLACLSLVEFYCLLPFMRTIDLDFEALPTRSCRIHSHHGTNVVQTWTRDFWTPLLQTSQAYACSKNRNQKWYSQWWFPSIQLDKIKWLNLRFNIQ